MSLWLDPTKRIQYSVAVQTPQYRINSLDALGATPIGSDGSPQLLGTRGTADAGWQRRAKPVTLRSTRSRLDTSGNS